MNFFKLLFNRGLAESQDRLDVGRTCGKWGIGLNLLLFAAKLIAGLLSQSISVATDAVNNLADASSSIVSLFGFHMAAVKADNEHPYGHARAEYISGLCVSIIIIVVGAELLRSSVDKILNPTEVEFSLVALLILVISIFVKLFMAFYNRKIGAAINSDVLKATAQDSRNDCITSSGVILGLLLSHYSDINFDGYIGALVAIFIIISGITLVKETVNPLLGTAPDSALAESIKDKILSYKGVIGAHDLIIHDYGPTRRFASVHVELPAEIDVITGHEIVDAIERDFLKSESLQMVVHLDPVVTDGDGIASLRRKLMDIAKSIHPDCTIHDLCITPCADSINVSFDCVKPPSCKFSDECICDIFETEAKRINPSYTLKVTVDSGFAPISHF